MFLRINLITFLIITFITGCSSSINYINAVNDSILETNGNQLNILTYNIQAIGNKEDELTDGLVSYLNEEQYDFVVFQELFSESERKEIIGKIDTSKYKSIISRIDYDSFPESLYQDAGLFLMSKHKQIDLSKIDFGDAVKHTDKAIHKMLKKEISLSQDFLSNKSVVGSLYQINDSTKMFLFATHVQALGSATHKRLQLNQIKKFIFGSVHKVIKEGVISDPGNLIVVLAGDFNIDAYDEEKFLRLRKSLGYPRDFHKEFNKGEIEYSMSFKFFNFFKRFDYIFGYDKLNDINLKKIKISSINTTDVIGTNHQSISDHLALKATIIID
ncbi:MAG: hypothetical protein JEY94_15525 [Melioribacteraceae bacterium]|nr:hypothetical protein [Melioribacteraceae bacterium]